MVTPQGKDKQFLTLSFRWVQQARGIGDDLDAMLLVNALRKSWDNGEPLGINARMALSTRDIYKQDPAYGDAIHDNNGCQTGWHNANPEAVSAIEHQYCVETPVPELATKRGPVLLLERQWITQRPQQSSDIAHHPQPPSRP